jgi:hypothetical protein
MQQTWIAAAGGSRPLAVSSITTNERKADELLFVVLTVPADQDETAAPSTAIQPQLLDRCATQRSHDLLPETLL